MEKSPSWVLMDLSESQSKPANKEEEAEKIEAETLNNNKAELEAEDKNNNRAAPPPMPLAGAQLTIFYNGSVSVYDAVTPEKAQAIMLIAAAAAAVSAAASANKVPVAVDAAAAANGIGAGTAAAAAAALTRSLSQQSSSAVAVAAGSLPQHPQVPASPNASSLCKLQADMPIARRQSLQQFLEKRRSRLVSKSPYAPAKKADEGMEVGVDGKPQVS